MGAIGFSAMMHGYMVFDKAGELLVPFRTWRNNNAAPAAEKLTELFNYHIPARWSVAHLYQAILNGEDHVGNIAFQTTLEGYVHWKLTGRKVIGIGEASGMFPVDVKTKKYNAAMLKKFDGLLQENGLPFRTEDILPQILVAGEEAGRLTEEGQNCSILRAISARAYLSVRPKGTRAQGWSPPTPSKSARATYLRAHPSLR